MAGLTTQGFQSATLEEIKAQIEADIRAKISPNVDLSSESPTGQLVGIMAGQFRKLWELAEAVYNAQYPDTANGFSLVSLALLTGTQQESAKPSVVLCDVNVDNGTYAIGTLHAAVLGDPTSLFANAVAVVKSGGTGTVTGVRFESEATGPVRANSGTLTVIAQAVSGWNSVTNPADAVLGTAVESDAALRQRREDELAKRGSATAEAVRADILEVVDVVSCTVLENDGDTTTGDGIPPHAMEAIVRGGTDADVAAAILATKPVGIKAHGSTVVSVTDSQGNPQSIGLTRPATISVYIVAHLDKDATLYPGDTVAKETVVDWGDANLVEGSDVVYARILALFMDIPGVRDVLSLTIGTAPAPVGVVNIPISSRQIADLDTAHVSIT